MKIKIAIVCGLLLTIPCAAHAVSSVDLPFDGSGSTLADTGFDAAYDLDTANIVVGGGTLKITIQPGDTFGQFENDPDNAKNMLYSNLDALGVTTVNARLTGRDLNQNFEGGGIWLGTDQDHYIRLGLSHNTFEGGIVVESLRENEDLWVAQGGPGGDIVSARSGALAASGSPVDVWLRLVQDGSIGRAFYSTDGLIFTQVGPDYDYIVTGPGQGFGGGPTIEGGFKVGVFGFGGDPPSTVSFDYFTANSVPEPGSLVALAAGLLSLAGMRLRRQ